MVVLVGVPVVGSGMNSAAVRSGEGQNVSGGKWVERGRQGLLFRESNLVAFHQAGDLAGQEGSFENVKFIKVALKKAGFATGSRADESTESERMRGG